LIGESEGPYLETMPQQAPDRAILIAGPTASGKSRLALRLAEQLYGIVINADSMQVYRELRILTARPTPQEEARVPHALYGFVSGAEAYSAARYAADAALAISEARTSGRLPIIVGGTGLYFQALLTGFSPVPPIDPAVRARWRAEAARRPAPELHALLAARDPVMAARLMPTDPQRIVRALEVLESTGRSLAEWQRQSGTAVLVEASTERLLVLPDRRTTNAAIEARFDAMLAAGAIEEVAALLRLGLSWDLPAMRALGVAPLAGHIAGRLTLAEASATAKTQTQQYAKRQASWLKSKMKSWKPLSAQQMETFSFSDLSFIDC
jgi:tRNA dimethylallyltransferase